MHSDIQGVLEEPECQVVWLTGALPTLPDTMQVSIVERIVREQDLHITGLEDDAAIHITDDLLVRPPWVDKPEGFSGTELIVPRGGAFGSGEHDSTKALLTVMHRIWPNPASLADCGTGSGILALYAHVRGCPRIEACDIHEPSVIAARDLLPGANVHVGGAATMAPCDMVLANMTGTELTDSLTAILSIWTRKHPLILSGMRAHEVDALVAAVPATAGERQTFGAFTSIAFAN